jgi:transposase-like protein
MAMGTRKYRKFDEDFKLGAVQLVVETGKPIAQVARELGINDGTLGNWCAKARRERDVRTRRWASPSGPSWSGCVEMWSSADAA